MEKKHLKVDQVEWSLGSVWGCQKLPALCAHDGSMGRTVYEPLEFPKKNQLNVRKYIIHGSYELEDGPHYWGYILIELLVGCWGDILHFTTT